MARARDLRRLIPLLALALGSCSWVSARGHDFADLWRLEGQVGYGLQAHAAAGELAHVGAGSSRHWSAGLVYGRAGTQSVTEHHFPVSVVASFVDPDRQYVHGINLEDDENGGLHRCYMIFPGALNPGTVRKDTVRYLDLEAGFLAGVVGIEAGFSPGELLDFVLGLFRWTDDWTVLDPAVDDDPEERAFRRLWHPRRTREGVVLPE